MSLLDKARTVTAALSAVRYAFVCDDGTLDDERHHDIFCRDCLSDPCGIRPTLRAPVALADAVYLQCTVCERTAHEVEAGVGVGDLDDGSLHALEERMAVLSAHGCEVWARGILEAYLETQLAKSGHVGGAVVP